jgi:hypothetical protein
MSRPRQWWTWDLVPLIIGGGFGVLAQYLAVAYSHSVRQLIAATLVSIFVGSALLGVLLASSAGPLIRAFVAGFVGAMGSVGIYTAVGVSQPSAVLAWILVLAPILLLSGLVGGATATIIVRRRRDAAGHDTT